MKGLGFVIGTSVGTIMSLAWFMGGIIVGASLYELYEDAEKKKAKREGTT